MVIHFPLSTGLAAPHKFGYKVIYLFINSIFFYFHDSFFFIYFGLAILYKNAKLVYLPNGGAICTSSNDFTLKYILFDINIATSAFLWLLLDFFLLFSPFLLLVLNVAPIINIYLDVLLTRLKKNFFLESLRSHASKIFNIIVIFDDLATILYCAICYHVLNCFVWFLDYFLNDSDVSFAICVSALVWLLLSQILFFKWVLTNVHNLYLLCKSPKLISNFVFLSDVTANNPHFWNIYYWTMVFFICVLLKFLLW